MDTKVLAEVLSWIIASGGAAALAYILMEKVPALANLASEYKRYTSLGLAAAIAMAAFGISVLLGYQPTPATAQAWLEALFAVAFVSVGGSQIIHGRAKLRS